MTQKDKKNREIIYDLGLVRFFLVHTTVDRDTVCINVNTAIVHEHIQESGTRLLITIKPIIIAYQ